MVSCQWHFDIISYGGWNVQRIWCKYSNGWTTNTKLFLLQKKKSSKSFIIFIFGKIPCPVKPVEHHCALWQYRLSRFQTGDTKLERFLSKNQHTQRKWLNFKNWCSGELSKIGHHFRKLMLSKNVYNRKSALKMKFFNEKNEKDSNDFWHSKLNLKVKFWHFLTPAHYINSQNSIVSFGYVDFLAKISQILLPHFENSTTRALVWWALKVK